MAIDLLTPLLDEGIRNPNFFEGRLLTAADLRADQEAQRARQRRLGRAIGPGVVEGLWVTIADAGDSGEPPALTVTGGLALNRKGQALEIVKESETVRLVIPAETTSTDAGLFADCQKTPTGVTATGEGVYLLVLSPASGFRDRAPMSGLSRGAGGAGCGSRWLVEGVQLRLEPWDPLKTSNLEGDPYEVIENLLGTTSFMGVHKLRSLLAHVCLGTLDLPRFADDPFARDAEGRPPLATYGPLDDLYSAGSLTDCDVPLALVYWTAGGIRFVDNWAVRRRTMPSVTAPGWPFLSGGRRRAEAEATLFQFQDQLANLLATASSPNSVRAIDHFAWLPAACLVPYVGQQRQRGFTFSDFFQNINVQGTGGAYVMTPGEMREALERSLSYLPVEIFDGSYQPNWHFTVFGDASRPTILFASYELYFGGKDTYYIAGKEA